MKQTRTATARRWSFAVTALAILGLVLLTPTAVAANTPGTPCGAEALIGGAPTAVVVVLDGVNSADPQSGTAYPVPVPHPQPGVPVVSSYCPVTATGGETAWPAGVSDGLKTWAKQGNSTTTGACSPTDGLDQGRCLMAELSGDGAIVLPYSYAGAVVRSTPTGPVFSFTGYTKTTTEQPISQSVANLGAMLNSIRSVWPHAYIYLAGHSMGGMIAEQWWQQAQANNTRPSQINTVFTLDSPINGVPNCAAAAYVVGVNVAEDFCQRWLNRDSLDSQILALDHDGSLVAFGTNGDPAYNGLTSGMGNLRPQLIYACPDSGSSPTSSCIASPPSFVSPGGFCDPTRPGIEGDGHHLVMECPAVVAHITGTVGARPTQFALTAVCLSRHAERLSLQGDLWAARRVTLNQAGRRARRLRAPYIVTVRATSRRALAERIQLANGGTRTVTVRPHC